MHNDVKTNEKQQKGSTGNSTIRTKVFVERTSIIEELMKNERVRPVYSMFITVVITMSLSNAAYEYYHKGRINIGQRLIVKGFTTFQTFLLVWIPVVLSNFLYYYGFIFWASVRSSLAPKSSTIKRWDYFWLGLTIAYYPGWLCTVTWFALTHELSIFLAFAVYCEFTRMMMKMHAFIRSNVPRVLSYKPHTENGILYPKLSQYLYFFWAPTLIYMDKYPRNNTIRWSYVATRAFEFLFLLVWISAIVEWYFIQSFNKYGIEKYSWTNIAVITIGNAGGGLCLMISLQYTVLHVWHNAFAEILRFGDRGFYEDWWGSSGYERYYRTWNLIVHEWLYTYLYKDFHEIIVPKNKVVAKYAVFIISAIFHEYIVGFGFGYFLPIIFIQFTTFGTILVFVKMKPDMVGNVFILYTLGLGNAINGAFLTIEYFARINCPIENPTISSYLIPRLFSCGS